MKTMHSAVHSLENLVRLARVVNLGHVDAHFHAVRARVHDRGQKVQELVLGGVAVALSPAGQNAGRAAASKF